MSKVGFIGRIGQPYPISGPWYVSPQYAAIAQDGSTVYPTWIFDGLNQRYAKSSSPNGSVAQTSFSDFMNGFSRASSKWVFGVDGTLVEVPTNQPAFAYNAATLQPLGLLVEKSDTNLLEQSNVFGGGYYTLEDVTFVNAYEDLKGISGSLMKEGVAMSGHSITRSISFVSGAAYTLTRFVKQGVGTRNIRLALPASVFGTTTNAIFNPSTGAVVSTVGSGQVADSLDMGGGVYRIRLTATATVTAAGVVLNHLFNGTTLNYQGDGVSGVVTAGFQLGVGNSPTSYIPTAGSTVTRARDIATTTDVSWYNEAERKGSIILTTVPPLGISSFDRVFQLDDGTDNNSVAVTRDSTSLRVVVTSGGVTQADITTAGFTNGVQAKIGVAFEDNNLRVVLNGGSVASDVSVTIPTGITNARIGCGVSAGDELNGTVASATYYSNTLITSELQRLTA